MPPNLASRALKSTPRAIIYTRVSRDKREGRSVAEQEAECRRDTDREGWHLVEVLSDNDVSASRYSKKERPGWLRMMERLNEGAADVVVFWEMSRSTRHRREWAELAEIGEDRGLHIMVRGRVYDCTDPHDMAYLDNLVTRGVEEAGETRDRVMRTVHSLAEQGRPYGAALFGLCSDYDPATGALKGRVYDYTPWGPGGEVTPAGMVREAARRILGGETAWTVVRDWNRAGLPSPAGGKWNVNVLTQILRSPSVMGRRHHKGRIIREGGWPALVDEADYWALRERLRRPPRRGGRAAVRDGGVKHLLTGIATCGVCWGPMQWGVNAHIPSYRCYAKPGRAGGCTSRAAHLLQGHVEALLFARVADPRVADGLQPKTPQVDTGAVHAELAELQAELEEARAAAARTGPGRLPVATLTRLEEGLGPRIEELRAKLRPVRTDPLVEELAADPGRVEQVWGGWSVEQRRRVLRLLTVEVRVLRVGQVGRRRLSPAESVRIVWA